MEKSSPQPWTTWSRSTDASAPTPPCWNAPICPTTRFTARLKSNWRPHPNEFSENSRAGLRPARTADEAVVGIRPANNFLIDVDEDLQRQPGRDLPGVAAAAKRRSDPRHGRGRLRHAPPPDFPSRSERRR